MGIALFMYISHNISELDSIWDEQPTVANLMDKIGLHVINVNIHALYITYKVIRHADKPGIPM